MKTTIDPTPPSSNHPPRRGREGKGREGKGREGKGREGKGREGVIGDNMTTE